MSRWLVITVVALLSGLAGAQSPQYAAIKAYRIQQFSDAELKKVWEEAGDRQIAEAKQIEQRKAEASKQRQDTRARCQEDVVFRTRNEVQCQSANSTLWMLSDEQPRSREQIYEAMIVGICNFIRDRQSLIENKCLPPK